MPKDAVAWQPTRMERPTGEEGFDSVLVTGRGAENDEPADIRRQLAVRDNCGNPSGSAALFAGKRGACRSAIREVAGTTRQESGQKGRMRTAGPAETHQ